MISPVWPKVRQLLSPSSIFEKYGTASYEKSFAVLKNLWFFTDNSFILFLDLAVAVSSLRWGFLRYNDLEPELPERGLIQSSEVAQNTWPPFIEMVR